MSSQWGKNPAALLEMSCTSGEVSFEGRYTEHWCKIQKSVQQHGLQIFQQDDTWESELKTLLKHIAEIYHSNMILNWIIRAVNAKLLQYF